MTCSCNKRNNYYVSNNNLSWISQEIFDSLIDIQYIYANPSWKLKNYHYINNDNIFYTNKTYKAIKKTFFKNANNNGKIIDDNNDFCFSKNIKIIDPDSIDLSNKIVKYLKINDCNQIINDSTKNFLNTGYKFQKDFISFIE